MAVLSDGIPTTGDGRSHWKGKKFSRDELGSAVIAAGAKESHAGVLADIALSESRGYEGAVSPTGCRGPWQNCPPSEEDLHIEGAARHAVAKWADGNGASNWTNYNPTAARIVAEWRRNPSAAKWQVKNVGFFGGNPLDGPGGSGIAPDIPSPGDALGALAGPVTAIAQALVDGVNTIRDFFDEITSSEFWVQVLQIWGGAVLLGLGGWGAFKAAQKQGL